MVHFISRSEYLDDERDGNMRHEWVGGQMWMMTGGSGQHNRISGRLFATLLPLADQDGCRAYMGDMKVVTDSAPITPT